jgi:hypothetical protein
MLRPLGLGRHVRDARRVRHTVIFALVGSSAIGCGKKAPSWAELPAGTPNGEATLAGEPLAVSRASSPPNLDGKLDEAVWATASVAGAFVNPGSGEMVASSPVAGFSRLAWDTQNLYVGVVVDDGRPDAPFDKSAIDPHLWEKSSAVELMIQPGDPGDNREYFEIQVDTAGAVFDTRWDDYNRPITSAGAGAAATKIFGHQDWSAKLASAAFVMPGKLYSIEIAIPWSSFRSTRVAIPPAVGDVWRLNLYSFRDGQSQALAWSPIRGRGNFHKSSQWGRVVFR